MENKQFQQTKFDSMVTNRNMQLAKAVIPYINNGMGNYLGMYIKFKELQNAARIHRKSAFSAMNTDKHNDITNLFEDIKEFLNDDEKDTIDMMMSMMEMINMDDDTKQAFMGDYMDMFNMDMFNMKM